MWKGDNASLSMEWSPQRSSSTTSRRVPILYIGGWGRSGSTLLARMLGQVPGFVAVGELRDVWLRGCVENRLCGCGAPFLECPFWRAVGQEAFGGWDRVDTARIMQLRSRFDRPWGIPLIVWKGGRDKSVGEYVDTLASMYAAIRDVSSASIIVESSKIPSYAWLLTRIPGADVRVVHMVRDSRGVVFSWRKHVRRADRPAAADGMLRYGAVSASARYVIYNALTHGLRRAGTPYLLVRYEDLVSRPDRHLRRILRGVDVATGPDPLRFLEQNAVNLEPTHTVDGNPMRFAEGSVPLKLDEEWRRGMTRKDRVLVSALTSPLLAHYGYLGR
jgi:hypothetical protein